MICIAATINNQNRTLLNTKRSIETILLWRRSLSLICSTSNGADFIHRHYLSSLRYRPLLRAVCFENTHSHAQTVVRSRKLRSYRFVITVLELPGPEPLIFIVPIAEILNL